MDSVVTRRTLRDVRIPMATACVEEPAGDARGYVGTGHGRYGHRDAYVRAHGAIPAGLVIDHLCHNRACVNPDHLEAVTSGENIRRGMALITHCVRGHLLDEANTYTGRGQRECRTCHRHNENARFHAGKRK